MVQVLESTKFPWKFNSIRTLVCESRSWRRGAGRRWWLCSRVFPWNRWRRSTFRCGWGVRFDGIDWRRSRRFVVGYGFRSVRVWSGRVVFFSLGTSWQVTGCRGRTLSFQNTRIWTKWWRFLRVKVWTASAIQELEGITGTRRRLGTRWTRLRTLTPPQVIGLC